MTTNKESFEAWARAQGMHMTHVQHSPDYMSHKTQGAWLGWQAAQIDHTEVALYMVTGRPLGNGEYEALPVQAQTWGEWLKEHNRLVNNLEDIATAQSLSVSELFDAKTDVMIHARKRVQPASDGDSARLDFMVENELTVTNSEFDGVDMYYVMSIDGTTLTADFSSPRAAIDAYMKQVDAS